MYQSRLGSARDERLATNQGWTVRRVVRHEVKDQLHAASMDGCDESVEVAQRAEHRIDVDVVGDIVAEVGHRRGIDRRQPDRVDAEAGKVVEPLLDPAQVADAVTVRVLEGTADRPGR